MATKRRVKERYTRWDPADNLKSEADIQAYIIACFEGAPADAAHIAAALGDVARVRDDTTRQENGVDQNGSLQGSVGGWQS
jgi:DNA-binding phage protein